MSNAFKAIVAEEIDGKTRAAIKQLTLDDLPDEDVLVEVSYSTLEGTSINCLRPLAYRRVQDQGIISKACWLHV